MKLTRRFLISAIVAFSQVGWVGVKRHHTVVENGGFPLRSYPPYLYSTIGVKKP